MKMPHNQRADYIQEVFAKWDHYPSTNEMADKDRYRHGNMHLATRTADISELQTEQEQLTCPTCQQEYLTQKALNHHRANKRERKQQWERE